MARNLYAANALLLLGAILGVTAVSAAGGYVDRRGFVSLEFDDTHYLDYEVVFAALEQHGLKGTFAAITETSNLGLKGDPSLLQDIAQHGHEIQDHTTRHDYRWATHVDTLNDGVDDYFPYTFATLAEWDSLCERSLFILDSLGIQVSGWNQPGGWGPGNIPGHPEWAWRGLVNDSLYDLIAQRYDYCVGYGPFPNTAHLNMRGHNCPDRYPVFNVTHVTIDNPPMDEIKAEIADDVASGLWYPAVGHNRTIDMASKAAELIEWIDEEDIPVLTVREGVERITLGCPDPLGNQLPQALMQKDIDGNGKPDGFLFDCAWDTVTVPPVDSARCVKVFGQCETFCYGPEVGSNTFSIWAKSGGGSAFRIVYQILDFDWQVVGTGWSALFPAGDSWTLVDSASWAGANVTVSPDVDRVRFALMTEDADTVTFACPKFVLSEPAGVPAQPRQPTVMLSANPVLRGTPVRVGNGRMFLFDVCGRRLGVPCVRASDGTYEVPTTDLVPGVYFLVPEGWDSRSSSGASKVVVLD